MDINLPDMDGITATERLAAKLPSAAIIIMSVQGEADYLRRAMQAGAREFLVKPFSADELVTSVRNVHAREREKVVDVVRRPASTNGVQPAPPPVTEHAGQLVVVYSPKGGVGRTTVAINVAVAAAMVLGRRVCVVDGSFQFGDVGVLLNLSPKNKTIVDVIVDGVADLDSLEGALITHSSGVRVLLGPPAPEQAELVTTSAVKHIIEKLRQTHDLVIVDAWPWLHETTLGLLDLADQIVAVMTLEITIIKNMRLFLEIAQQPGQRRGGLDRSQDRLDHRQRRPDRGLCHQPGCAFHGQRAAGPGQSGHRPPRPRPQRRGPGRCGQSPCRGAQEATVRSALG